MVEEVHLVISGKVHMDLAKSYTSQKLYLSKLTGMLVIFWHKFIEDTICNSFLFNSK